jgi:hypothetical protein
MGLKRIFPTQDNTITNAFKENLLNRGTGSNMGAADILEIFSIYGQQSTSSIEKSRAMIQFNIEDFGNLPENSSYYLKLFNCPHGETNPIHFTLNIHPISSSWVEGTGLDMNSYVDEGVSNWIKRDNDTSWNVEGGDVLNITSSQYFDKGTENLEVNVTSIVESWRSGTYSNNGFMVKLADALENSLIQSYYTKKFFSRSSEYFVKRPVLEARWDETIFDDRARIFASSSMLSTQNLYNIYMYNIWSSEYLNVPSLVSGVIYVSLYETLGSSAIASFTGSNVQTGIYKAQIYADTTASVLYDVWHDGNGNEFYTGSFTVNRHNASNNSIKLTDKILTIKNLQSFYKNTEQVRINTFIRDKNWRPNIYTVATDEIENQVIKNMFYYSYRYQDGFEIIPVVTSSLYNYTKMKYDISGNYFDLDMSIYEPGYMYCIGFYTKENDKIVKFANEFKFRVEDE